MVSKIGNVNFTCWFRLCISDFQDCCCCWNTLLLLPKIADLARGQSSWGCPQEWASKLPTLGSKAISLASQGWHTRIWGVWDHWVQMKHQKPLRHWGDPPWKLWFGIFWYWIAGLRDDNTCFQENVKESLGFVQCDEVEEGEVRSLTPFHGWSPRLQRGEMGRVVSKVNYYIEKEDK